MNLTSHASWAALAAMHRVHANYAKVERDHGKWNIGMWVVFTAVFTYLVASEPSVGRGFLVAFGAFGIVCAVAVRHAASKRYDVHAQQAIKFQQLADQTYLNSIEFEKAVRSGKEAR